MKCKGGGVLASPSFTSTKTFPFNTSFQLFKSVALTLIGKSYFYDVKKSVSEATIFLSFFFPNNFVLSSDDS